MAGAADPTAIAPNNISNTSSSSDSKLYKGVRKRKWGKWVSEIRLPNSRERIWLGSYDTQEKAARAFDAALYCLRGRHASFNFPDTPLNFLEEFNNVVAAAHNHQSLSPQEIQEVAAKFANNNIDPPILMQEELEQVVPSSESESQSQRGGANSESSSITESVTTTTTTTTTTTYSCPLYDDIDDGSGSVQQVVDYGDLRSMDWRFSDMLDDLNGVAVSDFGLYSGPDHKMHYSGGDFLYSTDQHFEDNIGDQIIDEGEDAFSNHSFLWSWNF